MLFCRFLGIKKLGGSGLKVNVAAAIVVCIWIYNVAFNIPMFIWADVRTNTLGRTSCHPARFHPIFVLASCIFNVCVPLVITWTSYIGIIYKFKRSTNKVMMPCSTYFSGLVFGGPPCINVQQITAFKTVSTICLLVQNKTFRITDQMSD